ncbi:MAG: hypothetical protein JO334_16825 [Verrucomicrobia bacterium]|nr:hypothetical protein [Verrucomicrobiota bacterium]
MNGETDFLQSGEIAEVIFGWQFKGYKEAVMRNEIFKNTRFFDASPCPTHFRMLIREIKSPS